MTKRNFFSRFHLIYHDASKEAQRVYQYTYSLYIHLADKIISIYLRTRDILNIVVLLETGIRAARVLMIALVVHNLVMKYLAIDS